MHNCIILEIYEKEKYEKTIMKVVIIVAIVVLLIICGVLLYFKVIKPHNVAVSEYNKAAQIIKEKNEELDNELKKAYNEYDTSIKQYKQLTNPSEEFVIQRLQTIEEIADARAVTEDNDPNGKLNKPGGYTATVYFESKNIKQSEVYGEDIIEKGTKAGGAIEVYANEEDAKNRENYLAGFDGGILSSGSHKVIGTVLIRTSDDLTATQQKTLEENIIKALSELK